MNSMTGYGKGIAERDGRKIVVELKSVNHRFLDLSFKLPRGFAFAEEGLRAILRSHLQRGHVDVFVSYENLRADAVSVRLDEGVARSIATAAGRVAGMLDGVFSASWSDDGAKGHALQAILRHPDALVVSQSEEDEDALRALLQSAAEGACEQLAKMRSAEGKRLGDDLGAKLQQVQELTQQIDARRPQVTQIYREKLEKRVREALADVQVDEARLLNEVAFFVDKSNVDEEVTRLFAHVAHYAQLLTQGGAVGKQLDFLTQEMNREVNTIGSKSNDMQITTHVLQLKNVIEMMREQVQNLE